MFVRNAVSCVIHGLLQRDEEKYTKGVRSQQLDIERTSEFAGQVSTVLIEKG